jgi:predicted metalloprotease with PDZ domain
MMKDDTLSKQIDLWYSLGLRLDEGGTVLDVREGLPAWKSGLAPGMKIIAIDGQEFDKDILAAALKSAQHSSAPLAILTEYAKWYRTYQVDYHGGLRYPHLVRVPKRPDMLARIVAPLSR